MGEPSRSRVYQVDALRVIAIGLLVFYHVLISYQPFAAFVAFIPYQPSLERVWFLGEILNVWRIPILYIISGMGVRFAMERRSPRELVEDRATRILIPLFFGSVFVAPLHLLCFQLYHHATPFFFPAAGHLWFLKYLMLYFVFLAPVLVHIQRHPDGRFLRACRRLATPLGLLVIPPIPLMLEVWVIQPESVSAWALIDYHRFWYGFLCFFMGFVFASLRDSFWQAAGKACHVALPVAVVLYLARIGVLPGPVGAPLSANVLAALESMYWMLALLGYGAIFLPRPSRRFAYLNKAVFPVYIVHLPIQQILACVLFPLGLPPALMLVLHLVLTLALSLALYEFVIRRIRWLHPVLGLGIPVLPAPRLTRFAVYGLLPALLLLYAIQVLPGEVRRLQAAFGANEDEAVDYRHLTIDSALDAQLVAAAEAGDLEGLRDAVAEGANVNGLNEDGRSALGDAAWCGRVEAVQLLIEEGADVNLQDGARYRPLHGSLFLGRYEISRLLIENGASLTARGGRGETPLESMKAPYPMVELLAAQTGVEVEEESVLAGRAKIREYLDRRAAE